jgi:hypothetical protein
LIFIHAYPKLSDQGKQWLVKARLYLQQAIEDLLQKSPDIELDNDMFRDAVFSTHADSYMRAGVRDLSYDDWIAIFKTPDKNTWLELAADKQLLVISGMLYEESDANLVQVKKENAYDECMEESGDKYTECFGIIKPPVS